MELGIRQSLPPTPPPLASPDSFRSSLENSPFHGTHSVHALAQAVQRLSSVLSLHPGPSSLLSLVTLHYTGLVGCLPSPVNSKSLGGQGLGSANVCKMNRLIIGASLASNFSH